MSHGNKPCQSSEGTSLGAWGLECLLRPGDEQPAEYPGTLGPAARRYRDAR